MHSMNQSSSQRMTQPINQTSTQLTISQPMTHASIRRPAVLFACAALRQLPCIRTPAGRPAQHLDRLQRRKDKRQRQLGCLGQRMADTSTWFASGPSNRSPLLQARHSPFALSAPNVWPQGGTNLGSGRRIRSIFPGLLQCILIARERGYALAALAKNAKSLSSRFVSKDRGLDVPEPTPRPSRRSLSLTPRSSGISRSW